MTSPVDPATTTVPATPRPIAWLAGAIIGTTLLSLMAAQLPDRSKLLGLFPLIFGGVVGWGLRWWANECQMPVRHWMVGLAGILLIAGEIAIVLQAWQVYRAELNRQFARDPSAAFARQALQAAEAGQKPEQIKIRNQFQEDFELGRELRNQELALSTYLRRRLSKRGDISQPIPELFWAAEIVLVSVCGVVVLKIRPR